MQRRGKLHQGVFDIDRDFRARISARVARAARLASLLPLQPVRHVQGKRWSPSGARSGYERPVIVKVRYHDRTVDLVSPAVRLARYIEKDGPAFTADLDHASALDVTSSWEHDRRVFHVIVSPNDGDRIGDMRDFTRRFMASLQAEVGVLDWVAAAEEKPDSAHPGGNRHVHILVRGARDGHDLHFGRKVVQERFRHHAVEVATDVLGYMDEGERERYERQLERMRQSRQRDRNPDRGRDPGRGDLP